MRLDLLSMRIAMNKTDFSIDSQILSSCFHLGEWPLSTVLLKNNANYPWLILVPRIQNITEIDQLTQNARALLIEEISTLSSLVKTYFRPDKLNVGTLGNMVAQLHIHVVGRFIRDKLWPQGIWQNAQETSIYSEKELSVLLNDLKTQIASLSGVP